MSRKDTLNALFRVVPPAPSGAGLAAPEIKSAPETRAAPLLGAPNSDRISRADAVLGAPNSAAPPSPAPESPAPKAPEPAGRVRAGAVGALAGTLRDLAGEAEQLRAQIAAGDLVVRLDPALIDPAPVADRLRGADDAALEDLKASIAAVGQQVPVLVRPHPTHPARYQAAYGHRRIRAARELGIAVNAVVRPLDDTALAIAQGQENIARRDLSFIEKAYFAQGLEAAGLPRAAVIKALATDKGDLSRYIAVAEAVPIAVAQAIGPAPRAGRARWLALAAALAGAGEGRERVLSALAAKQAFQHADSDGRFQLMLNALAPPRLPPATPLERAIATPAGAPIALLKRDGQAAVLTITDKDAPGFAEYLARVLPDIHARFTAEA